MRIIVARLVAAAAWIGACGVAYATVRIHVDLSAQTMHVESSSGDDFDWPVSTGRPGHRTPTGVFHPQAMYAMAHSIKYENAPMPHSIFFHGDYAIHGTDAVYRLGRTASHGCVRLAPANAARLFAMVKNEGATITISGKPAGEDRLAAANPRRASHRVSVARRRDFEPEALGYAPRPAAGLIEWVQNPYDAY